MNQRTRILTALAILLVLVIVILGVDYLQRQKSTASDTSAAMVTITPGSIPIYLNGKLAGAFSPTDLQNLEKVSFVEEAEGKTQEGWLLKEILALYIPVGQLKASSLIIVSSSSRNKSAQLTWAKVSEQSNMVMFDLSNRGTLKLASLLPELESRDAWIQDVDKIEVKN
jgi:hypothetical protein